jgi:hypothetical protein
LARNINQRIAKRWIVASSLYRVHHRSGAGNFLPENEYQKSIRNGQNSGSQPAQKILAFE